LDSGEHYSSILTLSDNITLTGYSGNTTPVVIVTTGSFYMEGNSKIMGNTNTVSNGGGVYINGGSFYMNDTSSISGNTASNGGGVYVNSYYGGFWLSGGTVYGSNAAGSLANKATGNGAALAKTSDSTAKYGYNYSGSNILPHTEGNSLYTNYTITR